MYGTEHMWHLQSSPDGDDLRWSQGYQRGGVPDIEPIHAPYYSDTLTRAWSVMCGLLWGSFGFVLGAVVVMALR